MSQVTTDGRLPNPPAYGIKSVEGYVYLTKPNIVNANEVAVGDEVVILALPNGKFYLDKTDSDKASVIEKITLSHIFFERTLTLEEDDGFSRES